MTNTPSTAAAALGTEFGVAGPAATDEHSQTQPYTRHAARLVDALPGDRRAVEIAGLARQIVTLSEGMRACADHLTAEAGFHPPRARVSWRRRFEGWLLDE